VLTCSWTPGPSVWPEAVYIGSDTVSLHKAAQSDLSVQSAGYLEINRFIQELVKRFARPYCLNVDDVPS